MKKFRKIMAVLAAATLTMGSMTIPAWAEEPGTFTLTYDGNGGTPTKATDTSLDNGNITLDGATRANDTQDRKYILIGWTEQKDTKVYGAGDTLATTHYWPEGTTKTLTEAKTLYALWGYDLNRDNTADYLATDTVTITYNKNGAEGGVIPDAVTVPQNSTYYLAKSNPVPSKSNKVFLGWTTTAKSDVGKNGTPENPYYIWKSDTPTTIAVTTENVNLYAYWADDEDGDRVADYTERKHTITYNLNDTATKDHIIRDIKISNESRNIQTTDMLPSGTYKTSEIDVVEQDDYKLQEVTSPAGTKARYNVSDNTVNVAFIGWTATASAKYDLYHAGDDIPGFVTTGKVNVNQDLQYWAVWGYDSDGDGVADYNETKIPDQTSNRRITVNEAQNGETYKAFRMLALRANSTAASSDPTAYAYTVAPGWEDFFSETNKSAWENVLDRDSLGYFSRHGSVPDETAWAYSSEVSKFAEAAAKYAKERNLTAADTQVAASGTATLNVAKSGYYLVTSTLGTRAMVDTTPGDVTTKEKNALNTVLKQVKEGGAYATENDAQIGDTVEFKIDVKVAARSINVVVHDVLPDGLTFNSDSIKVYTNSDLTQEYKDAVLVDSTDTEAYDANDTFALRIPDTFAATSEGDQHLYVVYTAELNKAILGNGATPSITAQTNRATVKYGNKASVESTTTTTTHKITVNKTDAANNNILPGAIFELVKDGKVVNLVKIDDNNYRVADDNDNIGTLTSHYVGDGSVRTVDANALTSDLISDDTGAVVIWGVDSGAGYQLNEKQAPDGYYRLQNPETIPSVSANNDTTVSIANQKGSELPSTGGMGTTVLYIVGGMLVILAGAYLFFSRKKTA